METKVRELNNRLRVEREHSRLSQHEVAKLLDIDITTVSKHESGDRNLTPAMVERYARLYKIPTWRVFLEDL